MRFTSWVCYHVLHRSHHTIPRFYRSVLWVVQTALRCDWFLPITDGFRLHGLCVRLVRVRQVEPATLADATLR